MTIQIPAQSTPNATIDPPPIGSKNKIDRHLTTSTEAFGEALKALDLSGLAVLELGCGEGHLLRAMRELPEDRQPKKIYAFEILYEDIGDDIKEWAADESAKPRLILNPPEYKMDAELPDGDFTNYDFLKMLDKENGFAIVSNPPYFLWNRILSLTGDYILGDNECIALKDKFKGALGITSEKRLPNHPGWLVRAQLNKEDFTPVASTNGHYVIQTGFEGRYDPSRSRIPEKNLPQGFNGPIIGVAELRESLMQRKEEWGSGYPEDKKKSWGERVSNDNIPASHAQKAPVIYLLGYPGTGKAAIAEQICAATGAELCDSHRWNESVYRKYNVSPSNPPTAEVRQEVRSAVVDQLRDLKKTEFKGAVFTNKLYEGGPVSQSRFVEVRDLAAAQEVALLTVRLICDKEEIVRRGGTPSRAAREKLTAPKSLETEMENNTLYHPRHPGVVDMDVTHMTADEAAARVMLVHRCMRTAGTLGIPLQELADKAAAYQPDAAVDITSLDKIEADFRRALGKVTEKGDFSSRIRAQGGGRTAPSLP